MALGQNIKHLMARLPKTSFSALAAHCGSDPQAIQVLVKRDSKTSQFAPDIAQFFSLPLSLLLTGKPEDIEAYFNSPISNAQRSARQSAAVTVKESSVSGYRSSVPVVAVLTRGSGELYTMEESTANEGEIAWPVSDIAAFALRILGDSLAPRARHGEYLIIEPNRAISAGDEVVVRRVASVDLLVAVFSYERDGMHYFEDLNGKGNKTSLPSREVQSMQYISGYAKSALLL